MVNFRNLQATLADVYGDNGIQAPTFAAGASIDFPPAGYSETFQVTAPVAIPHGATPSCTVQLGWHAFASSYGKPWVINNFTLPAECSQHGSDFSKVVLQLQSSSKGRQFDRVYQVWFDGAEALRGCTDEPTKTGVWWQIQKDVTDFSPILKTTKTITVGLDNINDKTYTGVYNTSIALTFYAANKQNPKPATVPVVLIPLQSGGQYPHVVLNGKGTAANFALSNLPKNIKRAELEYFVSPHQSDEFYYLNVPDQVANPDYGIYGSGNFKELTVAIDGKQVGTDFPFQLLYTGAMNPTLWKGIVDTRGEDFPSYRFDLTPYASLLNDGAAHNFTLNVTTQATGSLWYVDANLRLWLDDSVSHTKGKVYSSKFPIVEPTVVVKSNNESGDFSVETTVAKSLEYSGSVGNLLTSITRQLKFSSFLNYTQQTNVVVGYHNIDTITETVVTNTKNGQIASWTSTVASYPFTFNFTYTNLNADGSLYYFYSLFDKSRNINSVTVTGADSQSSSILERHIAEGFQSNSKTLPTGWLNENDHTVEYESLVIDNGNVWSYVRNVKAVNGTVASDEERSQGY
ncbi:UNVERIFIED_CONTAM: hypothetical protein HDU68_012446 [Siphonaria sp. JEL0065]|nr:hypothetical protein HDU68_012446 [Siphonaria sp. JEL0065]